MLAHTGIFLDCRGDMVSMLATNSVWGIIGTHPTCPTAAQSYAAAMVYWGYTYQVCHCRSAFDVARVGRCSQHRPPASPSLVVASSGLTSV